MEGIKLFDPLMGIFWDVKWYDKQVSTMKKPSKFAGFFGITLDFRLGHNRQAVSNERVRVVRAS